MEILHQAGFHLQMVIFLEGCLISMETGGKKHRIQWENHFHLWWIGFLIHIKLLIDVWTFTKITQYITWVTNYMWQSGGHLGKQLAPRPPAGPPRRSPRHLDIHPIKKLQLNQKTRHLTRLLIQLNLLKRHFLAHQPSTIEQVPCFFL